MILLIDNYDSFVYNLARYLTELGCEAVVRRNDAITVTDVARLGPQAIVLSPGPGGPRQARVCISLVQELAGKVPILGVCLGHQAIAAAFGADVIRAQEPVHGRTSLIHHSGDSLFSGLPNPLRATRYHSLIVEEQTLPTELRVTARTAEGIPMAMEHTGMPLFGVQFHPESILTEAGHSLLGNFLAVAGISPCEFSGGDRLEFSTAPDGSASEGWSDLVIHW